MKWILTSIFIMLFGLIKSETIYTEGYNSVTNSGGAWNETDIPIDISLHTAITIDVDYGEIGDAEKFDKFEIHYRIDAGAWSKPVKIKNDQTDASLSLTGLEGDLLEIKIRMVNDDNGETWWYDNLVVTGTPISLPVELIYFEHIKDDTNVVFNWMTGSEINNHCFIIERSPDGIIFEPIDTIIGNGNTTSESYYTYVDYSPIDGVSYYRLKQIDYDGQFEYSMTKIVDIEKDSVVVKIFPNPNNGSFNIRVGDNNGIIVVMYNSIGDEVFTKIFETDDVYIDLMGKIPKGIYYVIGTNKKELFRKTIVIQ